MLFSPEAAAMDRQIMAGHWNPPDTGDDYEAAERAYWPLVFGTDPPPREITPGKPGRRTTPTLREDVLTLHARGMVPTAIADVLNLKDRRVADIIRAASKTA